MPPYNSHAAYAHAVAMVTAALQSQSIKLKGPDSGVLNEKYIENYVAYINGLINGLALNLTAK